MLVHFGVTAVQYMEVFFLSRQSIELPESVKAGLDNMAQTLGMTQNALINLAVATMVAKYEAEGMRIFFDLISQPEIKKK
jgi:Ribbon-helix-helix protein, copG family.